MPLSLKQSVWCNTYSHGVPWMHLCFDRTFKYTAFPPSGRIDAASQNFWYENIYAVIGRSNEKNS
jgi:hypothetical protein